MYDLNPDPNEAGAHMIVEDPPQGRQMIFWDPGIAKLVGKQHDWNELEILAQGNRVQVACNGVQIVDWRDPEPHRIKAGPIGLQLHSNDFPQEVQFKGIKIETFPEESALKTVAPIVAPAVGLSERILPL